jgi:hypothetical protein
LFELFECFPDQKVRSWLTLVMLESFPPSRLFSRSGLRAKDVKNIFASAGNAQRRRWVDLTDFEPRAHANRLDPEWLDLLDWLGRQDYKFLLSHELTFADQLFHTFCLDPDRWAGFLPIIAADIATLRRYQFPQRALENLRQSNTSLAEDAILASLATMELDNNELRTIAREIRDIRNRKLPVARVLRATMNASPVRAASLALELATLASPISESDTENMQAIEESLVEFLTRSPSSLAKSDVWGHLHLPCQV